MIYSSLSLYSRLLRLIVEVVDQIVRRIAMSWISGDDDEKRTRDVPAPGDAYEMVRSYVRTYNSLTHVSGTSTSCSGESRSLSKACIDIRQR